MADTRIGTVREAVERAGLPESALIVVGAADEAACVGEVQQLAALPDPPTAIICANGVLSTGILRGIHHAGWRIPDDVSFLTFGDSIWHESYVPPIAVIRHDYAAAAQRGIDRLIARAESREPVPDEARRPGEFLPRSSIGPPPRRA